ncbi:MAG TPA: Crp/Fnr family transcriptional regulator [Cytophagales bacterium]|nr:Crp/Fnr family transcriptional regulator [Cytophagales bacterium]
MDPPHSRLMVDDRPMHTLFDHIKQYHHLNEDAKAALAASLQKVCFAKGTFLIQEGKVCHHLYFLEKGGLRGYYNLDGKEVTYWFGFENSFVTSFYSFVSRKASFEHLQLLEDSVLWSITYDQLQGLYDRHPDIERLGRIVHEKYYLMLEERFLGNHFKDAKERYENLLDTAPHILQRASLGQVASYLGISQETLSRIRGKV